MQLYFKNKKDRMKRIWLFRSNLRPLEYYHKFKTLEEFKKKCHDFYLLQLIWFLENDICDEAIVWRLKPKKTTPAIEFDVNGKPFTQRFVNDFSDCLIHPKPTVSFWRGGFQEYDCITSHPSNLGLKLYCGTGQRVIPQYGGVYDKILMEDKRDIEKYRDKHECIPFYKTASPEIFHPVKAKLKYDICWPANFTQDSYNGQKFFIKKVSESKYLKSLKIVHVGNKPALGKKMCKQFGVTNIEFLGWVDRPMFNQILNESKFGLCMSNRKDGCPRVITEILASGTPLLLREISRLLDFYKEKGVVVFNDDNLEFRIKYSMQYYQYIREEAIENLENISMKSICEKNMVVWNK